MIDDLLTSDYYREIYVSARRVLDWNESIMSSLLNRIIFYPGYS
jgi:hypothetical protein